MASEYVPISNDRFREGDNPVSLEAVAATVPGSAQSEVSGGTADILPAERAKASFDIETMTNILDGGVEQTERRRFIISPTDGLDKSDKFYWERPELLAEHVRHFMGAHEDFLGKIIPSRADGAFMSDNSMLSGSFINHFGLFLPTIAGQASGEQQTWWLPRTIMCKMIGVYCQTELGHGSNVRGLRTTATYDKETKEFVMHTPVLQAVKWWISGMGKLILDGKEYGVHIFMVQLRDENHRPLPGIQIGDVGPKFGDNANDTGFLRLDHVRIPREHMLARWQKVTEDGQYVKSERKTNPRVHYATMVFTRGGMIKSAGGWLARAVTIAARYSCVRHQGFLNTKDTPSHLAEEQAVINYRMQLYRILKQLSLTYAIKFVGNWMLEKFKDIESLENLDALPEIASTAAGLKGLTTFLATNGMEDLRKCCGGHGYLLSSGIAGHVQDYTTAEGDYVVMMLQCARFLIKALGQTRKTGKCPGPCSYLKPVQKKSFRIKQAMPTKASHYRRFLDPQYLLQLYEFRSLVAVIDADERFRQNEKKMPFDAAWNSAAVPLCNAVRAHCLTFMMRKFMEEGQQVKDQNCRKAVLTLACIYGLSNINDDQWDGLINNQQLKLARRALDEAMTTIRPDVVALVDAFDIPDRVLQSTLGRYDGNVYEALFENALKSPLNRTDPFDGYKQHLERFLDLEMMKPPNQLVPEARL